MVKNYRVGVPIIGGKAWLGGVTYIELLAKAVHTLPPAQRLKLFLVVKDSTLEAYEIHKYFVHLFDGIFFIGQKIIEAQNIIGEKFIHFKNYDRLHEEIDFYFPVLADVYSHRSSASWIPDLQHCYLPEMFSLEELYLRNSKLKKIAEEARIIVFSSQTAKNDFYNFFPNTRGIPKVLSFYSKPIEAWYNQDPILIQKKYNLPDRFILCSNQFWAHKNHLRLFEAIYQLKQKGHFIHLVCTGTVNDYRSSGFFQKVMAEIERLKLKDLIHILGVISRNDQIQLIRRCMFMVQPSLFEGWSTVVEDARALGKTILLSDLKVNIEQNPAYGVYFHRYEVSDLTAKLLDLFFRCEPGPDLEKEIKANNEAEKFINKYAYQFNNIVNLSQEI